ncbi:MAG TPA: hypothetical protein VFK78_10005 [Gemmatimonadales bacterium]|nr:hypothetical protein [Gemmatimonadales bacterium]
MAGLSGFTLVRNAVRLDYPIVPAIRSLLEVCDEVVVNVGRSDDDTRGLVTGIGDPRVRVLDTEWDFSRGSEVLAIETQRALDACRGRWGLYIQADEVLHQDGAASIARAVAECEADARVEGLLVNYLHFYGGFDTIATSRRWYRREVRCVRLGAGVRSYRDAQGFRVGPERRRVAARPTDAVMFHYGWATSAEATHQKHEAAKAIYSWAESRARIERAQARGDLEWVPLLRPFTGEHPRAAREWIAGRAHRARGRIGPRDFRLDYLRTYLSDWIERATGHRLFEYRNYRVV